MTRYIVVSFYFNLILYRCLALNRFSGFSNIAIGIFVDIFCLDILLVKCKRNTTCKPLLKNLRYFIVCGSDIKGNISKVPTITIILFLNPLTVAEQIPHSDTDINNELAVIYLKIYM